MSAPVLQSIYPNNAQTNVPVRAAIKIKFDVGLDLQSAKQHVVLYGPDFDQTSGPDGRLWIDKDTGANGYFLSSPGFSGYVPLDIELEYLDAAGNVATPTVLSASDESGYTQQIVALPKEPLAPNTAYQLYIIGQAEVGAETALSHRTAFDTDESSATSTTGKVYVRGSYEGLQPDDTINIEITTGGDIGDVTYRWYYTSEGVSGARSGKKGTYTYRTLDDGLSVRFDGSGFVAGDTYKVKVRAAVYMAASYKISFTTGTGSISDVPSTASTSVLGDPLPVTTSTATATPLTISSISPAQDAYHQEFKDKSITIVFSEALDAATVNDSTVTITQMPVSGEFTGIHSFRDEELFKKLTVNGSTLTIELF